MQVSDASFAKRLVADGPDGAPGLPPRISPAFLRDLAGRATLAGGSHETAPVIAPFSGRTVGEVWMGGPKDVVYAVDRARRAQESWARRPVRERAAVLRRFHDLVFARMQEGMDIVQLESGKARIDAFTETMDVAVVARYYAYHGPATLALQRRTGLIPLLSQTEVGFRPKGVVGVIAPWNYPLTIAISDALPALLAGNAVVIKPSELTPFSALWVAGLLYEAGLPPEVLHVVPGHGPDLGPALIDAVDYLQFTGSTEVGRIVGEQAGRRLIGMSLELGGKNPMVVRADANLKATIAGVVQACFSCAGQLCISTERIYVHESIFESFLERFRTALTEMVINARYDFSGQMGSLTSQEQLDKTVEHVQDALDLDAELQYGGHPLPEIGPFFYAPTVLTGVRKGMKAFDEETFGPVVSVYPYTDDDEAVARANENEYGLHASVWTRDLVAGRNVARQIHAGTVAINDGFVSTWGSTSSPMGGFKASGVGRRHGPEGLVKFTEPQTITTQLGSALAPNALGVSGERFASLTEKALWLVSRIPGLR